MDKIPRNIKSTYHHQNIIQKGVKDFKPKPLVLLFRQHKYIQQRGNQKLFYQLKLFSKTIGLTTKELMLRDKLKLKNQRKCSLADRNVLSAIVGDAIAMNL